MTRDRLGRLALGADKQHTTATGDAIAHGNQGLMQKRHGLGQINYVNAVAVAKDERSHFRVPTMGLVAKVNAGLQQLAHVKIGQSHSVPSFLSLIRRRVSSGHLTRHEERPARASLRE